MITLAAVGMTYDQALSRDDFRRAIEAGLTSKVWRPLRRRAIREGLRDADKFEELYQAAAPKIAAGALAMAGSIAAFDFNAILDWLMENWDEILKIILTIILFLI